MRSAPTSRRPKRSRSPSARLVVPLVLVSLLAAGNLVGGRATSALSTVPKEQFFAGVAGFLSYKLPLLARQFARAIQELSQEGAQAPVEKGGLSTGSLGMMVRLAKESKEAKARAAGRPRAGRRPPPTRRGRWCSAGRRSASRR